MLENRRITFAALCVTAVVGVAGPLITWRAAVSGQNQAAQNARGQEDLSELRSVLDGSLEALDRLEFAVQLEMVAWERKGRSVAYRAKHIATDRAYITWQRARDRLEIRLGQKDKLVELYVRAGAEAFAGSLFMDGHHVASYANTARFASLVNTGVDAKHRFVAATSARFGSHPS
jgi:hypothetical protein